MFPQVIRRRCAGAQNIELVYYDVGRESVEMVYYNVAHSDAEAGPSEEEEYHLYEEIDQPGDDAEAAGRSRTPPVYEVEL